MSPISGLTAALPSIFPTRLVLPNFTRSRAAPLDPGSLSRATTMLPEPVLSIAKSNDKTICASAELPVIRPLRSTERFWHVEEGKRDWAKIGHLVKLPAAVLAADAVLLAAVGVGLFFAYAGRSTPPSAVETTMSSTARAVEGDKVTVTTTQGRSTAPPPWATFVMQDLPVMAVVGAALWLMLSEVKDILRILIKTGKTSTAEAQKKSYDLLDQYRKSPAALQLPPDQLDTFDRTLAVLRRLNRTALKHEELATPLPPMTEQQIDEKERLIHDTILDAPRGRIEVTMFRTREGQAQILEAIERKVEVLHPDHRAQAIALLWEIGLRSTTFECELAGRRVEREPLVVIVVGDDGLLKTTLVSMAEELFGTDTHQLNAPPERRGGASTFEAATADQLIQHEFPTSDVEQKGTPAARVYESHALNAVLSYVEIDVTRAENAETMLRVLDPGDKTFPFTGLRMGIDKRETISFLSWNPKVRVVQALLDRATHIFHVREAIPETRQMSFDRKFDRILDQHSQTMQPAPVAGGTRPDRTKVPVACLEPGAAKVAQESRAFVRQMMLERSVRSTQSVRLRLAHPVVTTLCLQAMKDGHVDKKALRELVEQLFDARDQLGVPYVEELPAPTH